MSKMINLGKVAQVTRDIYFGGLPDSLGGPCDDFDPVDPVY